MPYNDYLTLKEAAAYLKVSTFTLRRAVKTNCIEVYRVGNAADITKRPMRFTRDSLDRYATRNTSTVSQLA